MTIYKIRFKRTKESEWENGIRIESNLPDIIIDNVGRVVEGFVWEITNLYYDFYINLTPILKD